MYSEINFNLAPHAGSGFERNLNCEDRRVDWVCYPEGYACLQRPFPLGSHAMIDDFSPEIAGSPFKTNDMGTVVGVARTRMDAGDVDGKFCDRRIEIQGQNGIRWWYKETSLVRILKVFDQYCPEYLYVVSHSPTAPSCAAAPAQQGAPLAAAPAGTTLTRTTTNLDSFWIGSDPRQYDEETGQFVPVSVLARKAQPMPPQST